MAIKNTKTMKTTFSELHEMVNSFMLMTGQEPFAMSVKGDEREQVRSLIQRYVARLRALNPRLSGLPDELVDDVVLRQLRAAHEQMCKKAK